MVLLFRPPQRPGKLEKSAFPHFFYISSCGYFLHFLRRHEKMKLEEKILMKLRNECNLVDEVSVHNYIMKRKEEIVKKHIETVYPIYKPGEGWKGNKYYFTKLTPKDRQHENKVYGKTLKELENKIVAYYLNILDDKKLTLEKILSQAILSEKEETGKRKLQRLRKWFPAICNISVSRLTEENLRKSIEEVQRTQITKKEFNNVIGVLNTIYDYCVYEHIDIIDIRTIISTYRKFKMRGKRVFKEIQKQDSDLSFSREEAQKIMRYAIQHPNYKTFAVAIMISTGLRAGELLGLEIKDIDLRRGRIWVHQMECTKTYDIEQDCKDHSVRYVYLTADAEIILKKALEFRKNDPSHSPFLLLNSNSEDGKLHLRAIDHHLREVIHYEVLKLDSSKNARSSHDCRRTYASLEYLSGTDIRTIRQQMGHTSEGQTWEYIKDIVDAEERKARLKGGTMLGEIA